MDRDGDRWDAYMDRDEMHRWTEMDRDGEREREEGKVIDVRTVPFKPYFFIQQKLHVQHVSMLQSRLRNQLT